MKKRRFFAQGRGAACVALLFAALAWSPGTARAATNTWDGGAINGNWTSNANWAANLAFANGNDVIFYTTLTTNFTFLGADRVVNRLIFNSGAVNPVIISGNTLVLENGIRFDPLSASHTISSTIVVTNDQTWNLNSGQVLTASLINDPSDGNRSLTVSNGTVVLYRASGTAQSSVDRLLMTSGATLQLSNNNHLGDTTTSVDLDSTSTLNFNNFTDAWRGLSGSGTVTNYGVGNLDLRPIAGDRFVFSGTIHATNNGVGGSWVMQGATVVGTQVFETTLPFQQNIQILQGVGALAGANGTANLVTNIINIGDGDLELHGFGTNAVLLLDNSAANNANRLSDTTRINLRGSGELRLVGNDLSDSTEDVGAIRNNGTNALTGYAPRVIVSVDAGTNAGARLTADDLQRTYAGGTFLFRGDNLGMAAIGAGTSLITFTTSPTLSSNGTLGTPQAGILPYAIGDNNPSGYGAELVTYDANGVRLLAAAEYTNAFGTGEAANVALASSPGALGANATELALKLDGAGVTADLGGNTLTLSAGAILSAGSAGNAINNGFITFGTNFAADNEGFIYTVRDLSLGAVITNNGASVVALTKSGEGTLYVNAAQGYTGKTQIDAGEVVVTVDNGLAFSELSLDGILTLSNGVYQKIGMLAGSVRSHVNIGSDGTFEIGETPGTANRSTWGKINGDASTALIKSGGDTMSIRTEQTNFFGNVIVRGGTLEIIEATGDMNDAAGFRMETGGILELDNQTGSDNDNEDNRIGNNATLTFHRGTFIARASNNTRSDENTGAMVFEGGFNAVRLDSDETPNTATDAADGDVRITADSLIRLDRATGVIAGDRLGQEITGTNQGQAVFRVDAANVPVLSHANTTPGTTDLGIIPWLTGGVTNQDNGSTLLTYDFTGTGANGFRPLDIATEFVNQSFSLGFAEGINATVASNNNFRVTFGLDASDAVLGAGTNLTVRGLVLNNVSGTGSDFNIGAGNTLTVESGIILSMGTANNEFLAGGNLTFGPNAATGFEGHISAPRQIDVRTVIADNTAGGVTNGVSLTTDGTVVLYGANTYSGDTVANSGVLQMGANNSLPSGTVVTVNGDGVLRLNSFDLTIGGLQGIGFVDNQNNTAANDSILNINVTNANASYNFAGTIRNRSAITATTAPIHLTKTGPGTQILSGNNTYTGITTVAGGSLRLDSTNALPGGIGTTGGTTVLILTNGGVIGLGIEDFQRDLGTTLSNVQWRGSGGFAAYNADRNVNLGGATQQLYWASNSFVGDGSSLVLGAVDATHTLNFLHAIDLGGVDRTIRVENGPAVAEGRLSGILTGAGGLIKTGPGTLALAVSNAYGGSTVIAGGVLRLDDTNSIPGGVGLTGGASALILTNGGVVGLATEDFFRDLGTGSSNVQWTGSGGFSAHGADRIVNLGGATQQLYWGSNFFAPDGAALVLGADSATHTVDFLHSIDFGALNRTVQADDGTAFIDGRLSGSLSGAGGLIKTGLGTLELTGANTYSGLTEVIAGVLLLNGPNALSDNSLLVITNFSVVGLGTGDFTRTLGTNAGNVVWTGSGGFAAYGADRNVNLGGTTQQIAWGGGFYVPEIVDDSTLVLGASNATHTVHFLNGIDLGASNRTVIVHDGAAAVDARLAGVLAGAGGLAKAGGGVLLMDNTNQFTGGLELRDGRLILDGGDNRLQAMGAVFGSTNGNTSGRLQLGGTSGKSDQTFTGIAVAGTGASNAVVGGAASVSTLTLDLAAGVTNIFSNILLGGSGANENNLALRKAGSGVLVLPTPQLYTGRTIVAGGILSISNENALGGEPGAFAADQLVLDGGTLQSTATFLMDDANRGITIGPSGGGIEVATGTLTVSNVVTGLGDLTKSGAGTLSLRGATNAVGDLDLLAGVVQFYGGVNVASNAVAFAGADLTIGDEATDQTAFFGGITVVEDPLGSSAINFANGTNVVHGNIALQNWTNSTGIAELNFFAPKTVVYGDVRLQPTNGLTGKSDIDVGNSGDDSTEIYGSLIMDTAGKNNTTAQGLSRGDLWVSNNIVLNPSKVDFKQVSNYPTVTNYGGSRLTIQSDFDTNITDGIGFFDRLRDGTLANGSDGIVINDYSTLQLYVPASNATFNMAQKITIDQQGPTYWYVDGRTIEVVTRTNLIGGVPGPRNIGPILALTNVWMNDGSFIRIGEGAATGSGAGAPTVRLGITIAGAATNGVATLADGISGNNDPFDVINVRSATPGVAKVLQIGATNGRFELGSYIIDDIALTNSIYGVSSTDVILDVFNGRLTVETGADVQGSARVRSGSVFRIGASGAGTEGLMGLSGDGLVLGNLIVSNNFTPGYDGIGTLTVQGDMEFTPGTEMFYEIDGSTTNAGGGFNDLLQLSGASGLDLLFAGTLNVNAVVPVTNQGWVAGDYWTLMTYTGLIGSNTIAFGALPDMSSEGLTWMLDTSVGGEVRLALVIPEPSTWVLILLGLGLGTAAFRASRRRL